MSQAENTLVYREKMHLMINWSKLLDGIAWISCGYGIRPRHMVFLSCFIIVVFSLIFWLGNGIIVEKIDTESPNLTPQGDLNFLDNIYFSTMVFTAKTQVKWYPVGIFRYFATVELIFKLAAFSHLSGNAGQNHDPIN
ncbi:MAG TPA: hypothetical protein PKV33_06365 [Methanothrix sp.]|nr:hypothetical protein [Methanothrix sp.]